MDDGIQKLIRREHVLPHGISKIIAGQIENGVDRRKVTLNVTQLVLYAPQAQAQGFHCHLQKYSTSFLPFSNLRLLAAGYTNPLAISFNEPVNAEARNGAAITIQEPALTLASVPANR